MDRRRSTFIVPEIYEATMNPEHWDYVATMIAKLTHSKSACLFYKSKEIGLVYRIGNFGMPDNSGLAFDCSEGCLVDILTEKSSGTTDGEPVCIQVYPGIKGGLSKDSDFYKNWAKPNDIFYVGGARFFHSKTHEAGIAIFRDKASDPWEEGELRVINEVIPHLRRALNIYAEFSRLRMKRDALLNGLDSLVVGLILYDKNALPLYINPTAKSIINKHPGLKLQNDKLVLIDKEEGRRLQQAITDIAEIDSEDSLRQSVSIGINNPGMESPLPLLVTAIQTGMIIPELDYEGARVAVFLGDPYLEQPISADHLISVYSLTKSEAQVAISLTNGHSIDEIANLSNHSVHTIRSQLKSIFRKTSVSRQSELIKLLLSGPFAYRRRSTRAS